ncbi:hypothetical protein [Bathymodiolus japonicus methanotrophic gill symbiont]|uniref:hypothetical protein n=1 Tax=Bathymodiolus japonicus methanotrophic gill symbiont TaxID=113269 RepID=UPI001C8DB6C2|nr:hypothetical protein [Bathymodiolus japonicus methanotrophic gill symbiont]
MLLVTSSITVPVGFFFYMPDPALKQWDKEDKRLKKSGIEKKIGLLSLNVTVPTRPKQRLH